MLAVSSPPPRESPYEVIRALDEDGMAKLYLAHGKRDLGANEATKGGGRELVVLKQARSFVARDADLRRMFLDEARVSQALCHDNVVHTLGVIDQGDSLAMVMEYLDGHSFAQARERIRQHAPGELLALSMYVLAESSAGLHYAHSLSIEGSVRAGVVHRDVSPHNLVLTYDGRVKVVDFSLSRHALRTSHEAAAPFKGKLSYAAPEQVAGGAVDARTDLFALGVMLWEALTGRALWHGMDHAEIHARLLRHAWPSVRSVAPEADPELVALCEAAMHGRAEARLPSAALFRERLLSLAHELGLVMSRERAGSLLAEAFAEEREELRAELAAYFEGAPSASGIYPASH
jgi:serine/threonine-protein kinase